MIQVINKSKCCGCTACISVCPKQCISMEEDSEGFLYPAVDIKQCINCGLCEQVCPMLHVNQSRKPLVVYAAKNPNELIRLQSSSGGMFTLLAEAVIDKGGVVFGARFNKNWEVVHDYTDNKEGLSVFRGSKYVQSKVGDCYKQVKRFLDMGREVMFTGTPCQIAGLKNYLRKDYENLLAVDVICHGVPSPKIWRIYLDEILDRKGGKNSVLSHPIDEKMEINAIDFRSKSTGWKKYSFALTLSEAKAEGEKNTVLLSSVFTENPFMNAFLCNLSLRPSCYVCPFKAGRSLADITLGDFWGIENLLPDFDDDKGCSVILIYTDNGGKFCSSLFYDKHRVSYADVLKKNGFMEISVPKHCNRDFFFRQLIKGKSFEQIWESCNSKAFVMRLHRLFYRKFGI